MFRKTLLIFLCYSLLLSYIHATQPLKNHVSIAPQDCPEGLPYGGVICIGSKAQKAFSFCRGTITLINERDELLWLYTFIDEGVPLFALIKNVTAVQNSQDLGRFYALQCPQPSENIIIVIDNSFE